MAQVLFLTHLNCLKLSYMEIVSNFDSFSVKNVKEEGGVEGFDHD